MTSYKQLTDDTWSLRESVTSMLSHVLSDFIDGVTLNVKSSLQSGIYYLYFIFSYSLYFTLYTTIPFHFVSYSNPSQH